MKKLVHSVHLNVFEKNVENLPDIYKVFYQVLPIDFEKNHLKILHEQLEGFSGIIHSLTLQTTSHHHNLLIINSLFSQLTPQEITLLEQQKESRLNDDGVFYIRFDKQLLLQNIPRLTDSGDCFHMKIKLAAYPAKREQYFSNLQMILKQKIIE